MNNKIAIIVSSFNSEITVNLYDGAINCLKNNDISGVNIKTYWVPGSLEIPYLASKLASSKNFDGIIQNKRFLNQRLRGLHNREIVLFRLCVRARGDCQVEMSLKRDARVFPFPFSPREAFPFPLGSSPSSQAAIQL